MLAAERCSDGESAETFITRIKNLCDQMAAIGITKTSEELARRCIRILPQKYDALVTTLNTRVRNPALTFEEFSVMLLEEEMRMKTHDGGSDAAFSATSKGKGGEKKNGKRKKFLGKCHYCNKSGHMVKDCRKKQQDEKNGTTQSSSKGKETANTIETKLELWIAIEEICSSTEVSTTNDSWLLDTGASHHMTRNKDWYSSFKPLQEPMNVTVGNNAKCLVEGTGTIAFSIQEGETKELSDVLLVP